MYSIFGICGWGINIKQIKISLLNMLNEGSQQKEWVKSYLAEAGFDLTRPIIHHVDVETGSYVYTQEDKED